MESPKVFKVAAAGFRKALKESERSEKIGKDPRGSIEDIFKLRTSPNGPKKRPRDPTKVLGVPEKVSREEEVVLRGTRRI